ncbi:MAG: adenine deaminase C-terminal domain-containing protein [Rectinemataceae bacterium]
MIVEGARVFNVFRKRFEEKSVRVRDGIIVEVSAEPKPPSEGEARVDAAGTWLIPGLVDIHMHIESSMTVPSEFSRIVLPRGTTTVVADPHEIANVLGVEGIRAFMKAETGLDVFYGLPSSVPSTNASLETTGGRIGPDDVAALAADDRVICLGEVMNAIELRDEADTPTKRLIASFRKAKPRYPIEGHCPKIRGAELASFIASGVWADHTQQTPQSILEKIDNGMFIELQRKSITAPNIETVVEHRLYEHVALVTDDVLPDRLVAGHLNLLVRLAIERGMSAENAIYCATYTPARHMLLSDRGSIAPGRIADFILLDDPETFAIRSVYKGGVPVRSKSEGRGLGPEPRTTFPAYFYATVRRRPLAEKEFLVRSPAAVTALDCVTIRIDPESTFTDRGSVRCPVSAGLVDWKTAGLSLIAAIERYGHEAPIRFGFAEIALKDEGAVASTWAHDHHNLLVMGSCARDMALAANALIDRQGGYIVVRRGEIIADAPLPVGGIVSDGPLEELAESIRAVRAAMRDLGYVHIDEIMSFSTLSLLVSPRLKIGDKGLVDVETQTLVEPYEFPDR